MTTDNSNLYKDVVFPCIFVPKVYKTIQMDWPFMHVEPWLGTHCSGPERETKSLRWRAKRQWQAKELHTNRGPCKKLGESDLAGNWGELQQRWAENWRVTCDRFVEPGLLAGTKTQTEWQQTPCHF